MSRTLADVTPYQVYADMFNGKVWKDGNDSILCRRSDGSILSLVGLLPGSVAITGDSLGHVRDEPWRKADAGQPGSLADAHNRIDALQARLDALEQRPSVPVEPVNQCNAPPLAKPTQPPDVAVYERRTDDGRNIRDEMPAGSGTDSESYYQGFKRTVLDAFDRLTWDELRRWGYIVQWASDGYQLWKRGDRGIAYHSGHPTEIAALTAARAIARKEGWR